MRKEYIRFALLMLNNETTNYYRVISKIVFDIFLDNHNEALTINEILKKVKESFDLVFTVDEIKKAVEDEVGKTYLKIRNGNDTTYQIILTLYESKKNKKDVIGGIINRYNYHVDQEECEPKIYLTSELLFDFFYYIFNTNLNYIKSLCDGGYDKITNTKFKDNELVLIKSFLSWDDEEKNTLLFNIINSSYDYCSMSIGEGNMPSLEAFKSKKILLDTNVILSLLGINGTQRLEAAQLFIKKCKENSIVIKYTSVTGKECRDTLTNLVNSLSVFERSSKDIIDDNDFSSHNGISNIHSLFLSWVASNIDANVENYKGFEVYLKKKLDSLLYDFDEEVISESFMKGNIDKINSAISDIKEFKRLNNKKVYDNSVQHDAVNYVYLQSLKSVKTSRFNEQKCYFVSLDNTLCEWSRKNNNGTPSTWVHLYLMYSIILRFSNRSSNDILAFSQFVSVSTNNYYDESNVIELKNRALKIISSIDETIDVKKAIFIETNRIIDSFVESGVAVGEKEIEEKIIFDAVDNVVSANNEENAKKLKEEVERATASAASIGMEKGKNEVVDILAGNKAKTIIRLRKAILVLSYVTLIALLALSIYYFFSVEEKTTFLNVLSIVGFVFAILFPLTCTLMNRFGVVLMDTNFERVKNKQIKKISKKLK